MRISGLILVFIILIVLFADVISPYDPLKTNVEESLTPPGLAHPLGTDLLGRDLLSRVIFGGRRTLWMAGLAVLMAAGPGLVAGLFAGYSWRWLQDILQIMLTAFIAIPALVLSLVVLTLLGPGITSIAVATGVAQIPSLSQVVRGATIAAASQPYVEGALAVGAGHIHILRYHILPNVLVSVVSYLALGFTYALISSVALSFLGFGGDPSLPDWGNILAEGRRTFQIAPWIPVAPGVLLVLLVASVNALVDRYIRRGE